MGHTRMQGVTPPVCTPPIPGWAVAPCLLLPPLPHLRDTPAVPGRQQGLGPGQGPRQRPGLGLVPGLAGGSQLLQRQQEVTVLVVMEWMQQMSVLMVVVLW